MRYYTRKCPGECQAGGQHVTDLFLTRFLLWNRAFGAALGIAKGRCQRGTLSVCMRGCMWYMCVYVHARQCVCASWLLSIISSCSGTLALLFPQYQKNWVQHLLLHHFQCSYKPFVASPLKPHSNAIYSLLQEVESHPFLSMDKTQTLWPVIWGPPCQPVCFPFLSQENGQYASPTG